VQVPIHSAEGLGQVLRAVRKDSDIRLDVLAQLVGVSKQTATNLERGQGKLSTVLAFLRELGIEVSVDIPKSALLRLQAKQPSGSAPVDSDHA
jgi:DNA-binding XRE family transcriptional regulator